MMRTTIALIAAVAAGTAAGCSGAHPPRHAASASPSPSDLSCQTAENANIRAEGALGAGITAGTLSRAETLWRLASSKISNSGVKLLHTRDGRLTVDLSYAALAAAQAVLDIRLGNSAHLGKTMNKLFAAEQKIISDCQ